MKILKTKHPSQDNDVKDEDEICLLTKDVINNPTKKDYKDD
jgi:hypothetical protein